MHHLSVTFQLAVFPMDYNSRSIPELLLQLTLTFGIVLD